MSHHNLPLAREFFGRFLETGCDISSDAEIAEIIALLCGGDEYELLPLPGIALSGIIASLQKALQLCAKPAPMPTTGRDREGKQSAANYNRKKFTLHIRVCLALLGAGPEDEVKP